MLSKRLQLCEILKEISSMESDLFKSRAYMNAFYTIKSLSDEEFETRKSFLDLKGIGQSINSKILFFLENGNVPRLDVLRKEHAAYLDPTIYKVRKSGLITKKLPYSQVIEIYNALIDVVVKYDNSINPRSIYPLGSLRRKADFVADIDLLVPESDFKTICHVLSTMYNTVVSGDKKSTFVFDNSENTTIDVTSYTEEDFAFQLLHFTGSKEHNQKMRGIAKSKGLKLNQYGLFHVNDNIPISGIKSEGDIFHFLGMTYVAPEKR